MRIKSSSIAFLSLACSTVYLPAQTIWTNGGGDSSWINPSNWNPSVPTSGSAVVVSTQPTDDLIGVDTGVATTVASFTFSGSLVNPISIVAFGAETLQINGSITNSTSLQHSFQLPVFAGASSAWTGPLSFTANVGIGLNQVTLFDAVEFSGSNLNFDITSAATYGRFLGAGSATVTGVIINIGGSYTGVNGDTFDFTSGNFSGATLGSLPTLGGGLTWNTSNFLTSGTLSVVPEPGTVALATLGLTTILFLRRRRKD